MTSSPSISLLSETCLLSLIVTRPCFHWQTVASAVLLDGHQDVRPGCWHQVRQVLLLPIQGEGARVLPNAEKRQAVRCPRLLRRPT